MLLWIRDRFDFHENISDELLFNYISAPSLQKRQEAADYLEGRCLGLAMQMLNLSSDWLKGFMAHTMAKVNRVSFGLLLDEDLSHVRRKTSIRFRAVACIWPSFHRQGQAFGCRRIRTS
jgi:hypothetical protein